jgi:transposase
MPELHDLKDDDLQGLAPEAVAALAQPMLQRLRRQDREIRFKDARIEKIIFELARLKGWKFGAKTEAVSAEQRRLFMEMLVEDEASLQAQLEQVRGKALTPPAVNSDGDRKCQPLPDHLRRVEHRHEPEDTTCSSPGCSPPMTRVGEDISERLGIIPAEFFVHRHIYGKWACHCCQCLVQEAVVAQIIDGSIPAAGLVTHTLISRFVDHVPYYRQESINARSKVHTPRSTLASWSGQGWCGTGAAVRGAKALRALRPGAASRRDARGHAGLGRWQDPAGLRLGLRARCLRCGTGRGLRLLPRTRCAIPNRLPRRGRR